MIAAVFLMLGGPVPAPLVSGSADNGSSAVVFLMFGGPLPIVLTQLFPSFSPLLLTNSVVSGLAWYKVAFWGLPALVIAGAAVWRGRLFCRWLCPAGVVYEVSGKLGFRRQIQKRRWNGVLFWAMLFCAAYGVPLVMLLDPLATFNALAVNSDIRTAFTSFFENAEGAFQGNGTAVEALLGVVPGIILPIFVLLSLIQPHVWCTHFCPLGYLFDLCRRKDTRGVRETDTLRRDFLRGVAGGAGLVAFGQGGSAMKAVAGKKAETPVLPPGAGDLNRFSALCVRCYACLRACPTNVLRMGPVDLTRPKEILLPQMDFQRGFCDHLCRECLKVCPTGAIRYLSMAKKEKIQLGVASIDRRTCLAWGKNQYCVVCQEYCSYQAIHVRYAQKTRIPQPIVNPAKCRGCGYCEYKCPALRNGSAIIVKAHRLQTTVTVA